MPNLRWYDLGNGAIALEHSKTGPRTARLGEARQPVIEALPGPRYPDAFLFPKNAERTSPFIGAFSLRSVKGAAPRRQPIAIDGSTIIVRSVHKSKIAEPVSPVPAHIACEAFDRVSARGHRILADVHDRVRRSLEQFRLAPDVLAELRQRRKPPSATRRRFGIAAAKHLADGSYRVSFDDILFQPRSRYCSHFVRKLAPRRGQCPEDDAAHAIFRLKGEQFVLRHPEQPGSQRLPERNQRIVARTHGVEAMQHFNAVPGHFLPIDEPSVGVDSGQVDDPFDRSVDRIAAQDIRKDAVLAPEPRHLGDQGTTVELNRLKRLQEAV